MSRKSVGDIKTFANITDQRRARTPHGAYLELATMALHRHRLSKEQQTAAARSAAIEAELGAMARKATVLQAFIANPGDVAPARAGGPAAGETGTDTRCGQPGFAAVRERVLRY